MIFQIPFERSVFPYGRTKWNCVAQHVFSLMCHFGVHLLCAVYLCKVCIATKCFLMALYVLFSHMACGDVTNASGLIDTALQG